MELLYQPGVFSAEGYVGDGPAVGADIQQNLGFIEPVHRMMGEVGVHIGLQVAAGANFQKYLFFTQIPEERRIFYASDAVTYPGGMKILQGFPDAVGSCGFTGVGGAGDTMGIGVAEGGDVRIDGIACLVAGNVKAGDVTAPEFFYQPYGFHALLTVKMPERAKDHTDLYTGLADAFVHRAVYCSDNLFGREALF